MPRLPIITWSESLNGWLLCEYTTLTAYAARPNRVGDWLISKHSRDACVWDGFAYGPTFIPDLYTKLQVLDEGFWTATGGVRVRPIRQDDYQGTEWAGLSTMEDLDGPRMSPIPYPCEEPERYATGWTDGNSPLQRWCHRHPEQARQVLRDWDYTLERLCFDDHDWVPGLGFIPWPHSPRDCERVTLSVAQSRRNRSRRHARVRDDEQPVYRDPADPQENNTPTPEAYVDYPASRGMTLNEVRATRARLLAYDVRRRYGTTWPETLPHTDPQQQNDIDRYDPPSQRTRSSD